MEQLIFAVYDVKSGMYLEPFFARTAEEALRSFKHAANQPGHNFNDFAEDFSLFQLGAWDSSTGVIEPCIPFSLGMALTLIERPAHVQQAIPFPENEENNG